MTTEEQRPQDSTPEESNVPAAQPTAADVATPEAIEGAPPVTAPESVITPTTVVEQ